MNQQWKRSKEKIAVRRSFSLLLLCVNCVLFCNWVVFFGFVFLAWVLFNLIIVGRIVDMVFADAVFVAFGNHSYESFL